MTDRKPMDSAAVTARWHGRILKETDDPTLRGARRSARARLRRARMPLEVMQEPEALRLIEELSDEDPERVAILAGILAFVDGNDDRKIARAIGRNTLDEDDAIVSEARFRRLLQTPGDELLDPMRRLVRLTKGKVNVCDMSISVLHWGDGVRKRWIFDYYGVPVGAPPQETASNATPTSTAT